MEMKLTKSQTKELLNCHPGVGNLIINTGDTLELLNVHLATSGDFYTGTMLLEAYLKVISTKILSGIEEE